MEPGRPLVAATGLRKRFGATQALRGADLRLCAGEVHALLGENGAGKSTLIKILAGAQRHDEGTLTLLGAPLALHGVSDAVRRGIVPVYQTLSLLPDLSVGENLHAFELAHGAGWRRSRRRGQREEALRALARVRLDCDLSTPVAELSLAHRQLVEIARAVVHDCRVLILDEPTTTLSRGEVEVLFDVVRGLRAAGCCVLFISHRLDEVAEIADRVTVLRNGATVLDGAPAAGLSREEIVHAMAGEPVELERLDRGEAGAPVLELERLSAAGSFAEVSLTVRAGELLGVVGLIGSGALELGEAVAGMRQVAAGRIVLDGRPLAAGNRARALRRGIGYVSADRDRDGLFPTLDVLANGSVCALPEIARGGILRRERERDRLLAPLRALSVKPDDPAAPITALSGGNQQKVLVARALVRRGRVLVALEPTRGVDVGARHDIHRALVAAAADGVGVLLVSTDLEEVMAISHRVVVMRRGRVAAQLGHDADQHEVLGELLGAAA